MVETTIYGGATLGNATAGRVLARIGDRAFGGRGCLMTFHRCVADADWAALPNRDFYVTTGYLDRLLGYLARTGWAVVTMDEVVDRMASGDRGRYVNISVDDCYRDTAEQVVPVFQAHGVPVTLFVTTGIPDGTLPLWGAGLESVLAEREQVKAGPAEIAARSPGDKRQAFAAIATAWDGPQAAECYAAFCRDNDVSADALHTTHAVSWTMLRALRTEPCVEIGAHTVAHPRVSALHDAAAAHEIAGSRERLRTMLGVPCRHFAFPYGRRGDCGPRDMALARQAGFSSAATTRKGLARRGGDPFGLPRNTLNGSRLGPVTTQAHMTGVSGLAARVLGRV